MNTTLRLALLAIVSVAGVGCDQITKAIAQAQLQEGVMHSFFGDTVRFQLAHNYGAFLSLGASLPEGWRQALWSIGVGCVLLAMLGYILFAKEMNRPLLVALALILTGGASNLYDRISYHGYVVDFLNVGIGPLRTGIFNVADMGIMAGAVIILLSALRTVKEPN